ncbi:MAG TPA: hypothetical protein VMK84_01490 [Streptosporangiaceae bacterium]|nr:hypothetical protein [Streptosporangiaceae bacterium]
MSLGQRGCRVHVASAGDGYTSRATVARWEHNITRGPRPGTREICDALGTEHWQRRITPTTPLSVPDRELPMVSLHVPAHNEPPEMVIETLRSLLRLDYPRFGGIQLLRMHWRSMMPGRQGRENHLTTGQRWAYLAGAAQWYGDLLSLLFFSPTPTGSSTTP